MISILKIQLPFAPVVSTNFPLSTLYTGGKLVLAEDMPRINNTVTPQRYCILPSSLSIIFLQLINTNDIFHLLLVSLVIYSHHILSYVFNFFIFCPLRLPSSPLFLLCIIRFHSERGAVHGCSIVTYISKLVFPMIRNWTSA